MGNKQHDIFLDEDKEEKFFYKPLTELKTTNAPTPRCCHEMIQIDNKIFIFGGMTGKDHYRDKIHSFDLKTNQFQMEGYNQFPKFKTGFTLLRHNFRLIYFGGYDYLIHFAFIKNFTFSTRDSSVATRFHSAFIYDDKMFVFGGLAENNDPLPEFLSYYHDLLTFEWVKIQNYGDVPPSATHNHRMEMHKNGLAYMTAKNGFYEYNPKTYFWKRLSGANTFLNRYNSMTCVGKYIYFIGAGDNDSKIYRYDIIKRLVEKFNEGDFRYPKLERHSTCLVNYNDKVSIYAFGGWNDRYFVYVPAYYNKMYELDVTEESKYEFTERFEHLEMLRNKKLLDINFRFQLK